MVSVAAGIEVGVGDLVADDHMIERGLRPRRIQLDITSMHAAKWLSSPNGSSRGSTHR